MQNKPVVVLTGPTAVGKTDISIKLAKIIDAEIISADSIQIYKYMNIGSAKITADEMQGVKHYLIDKLYPDEDFNVSVFKDMANKAMEEIWNKNKIPLIVGGTGFYIQALLKNVDFEAEESDQEYRDYLEHLAKEKGNLYLSSLLSQVDEKSAGQIHPNNVKRVIRALEFYKLHGYPISLHNEKERCHKSDYNFAYFVLNDDREALYKRIDLRVDQMVKSGLIEEVKSLISAGYDRNLVSMQGIGYKEIASMLYGEYTENEAIDKIKTESRRFAKRQLTWFRRENDVIWINKNEFDYKDEDIINLMINKLEEKGILNVK